MITVERFKASPGSDESTTITWEIVPGDENPGDYVCSLKRTGAPFRDFDREGDLLIDERPGVFSFADRGISFASKYRNVWYLLRLKNVTTGETADYGPVSAGYEPDDYALLIMERNDYLLEEYTGVPVKVLKAKTWGPRCPDCWDELKQRSAKSRCTGCYDTGFAGGYYEGIDTFAGFSPPPEIVELTGFGELEVNEAVVLFPARPELSPRDLVVETAVNRRWRVLKIDRTEKKRARVHQLAGLKELDVHEDIEFGIAAT